MNGQQQQQKQEKYGRQFIKIEMFIYGYLMLFIFHLAGSF